MMPKRTSKAPPAQEAERKRASAAEKRAHGGAGFGGFDVPLPDPRAGQDPRRRPILGRPRVTANALEKARLPPPSAIPRLTRPLKELTSLPLDSVAALIAAQIDGKTNVQQLLDLGFVPQAVGIAALGRLVKLGVVVFA